MLIKTEAFLCISTSGGLSRPLQERKGQPWVESKSIDARYKGVDVGNFEKTPCFSRVNCGPGR
jgi:hypothetical protein